MCGIFDSVLIIEEPDFVDNTDDTEDTDTLWVEFRNSNRTWIKPGSRLKQHYSF